MTTDRCPACAAPAMREVHRQDKIPANSCLLLDSRREALEFPNGQMRLAFCPACGFLANLGFDSA
ncbi:MAG TPA: hypothetical protein VND23_09025, partial [Acidimicrobiales bacterium]|nr:hypothetical protein [Acidimicrobiales bacterium]